jgi:hypothetical protein
MIIAMKLCIEALNIVRATALHVIPPRLGSQVRGAASIVFEQCFATITRLTWTERALKLIEGRPPIHSHVPLPEPVDCPS